MEADFATFRDFQYGDSHTYLWVFKRSTTASRFSARYVQIDEALKQLLQNLVSIEAARITEFAPYTYLAQTNENSCLSTVADSTEFAYIKALVDRPEPDWRSESIKDLKGATGYVVKFVHEGRTVYAVKRSTSTWKTAYPRKFINMIFQDGELAAVENNGFSIERNFDFYCVGGTIFIASKRAFEAAMQHKAAYASAFIGLQASPNFSGLFTTMQPLVDYVGNNSIQLRRIATIEQKGLYAQVGFLASLRTVSANRGWGLNFDPQTNQLIPCEQTTKTIIQVLLDHRLLSEVTQNIYDVPDATPV